LTRTFWDGIGLQFINIKAWMLALTLTAGWVVNAHRDARPEPGRTAGHHLRRDGGVRVHQQFHLCLARLAAAPDPVAGRRLLWFNRAMGFVLLLTAVWMLTV
jgi:threonine/homoserine/homoserine lactone efflux protein